ncbi:heme-binding protein [Sphingomonas sp. SUN039]|uniref:heme-binding protein n=1 Tax=Sphingomonas sp. SUN039 TaxID=2937787 RepID=UPI0021649DC8|nr:heme-binding protein [Sphingomonas sp. SUN039]UVO53376.1 heme-binding protein [Sphingomonas sp. SUN039]
MRVLVASVTTLAFLLASCGGSDSSPSAAVTPTPSPTPTTLYAVPAQESLSIADVQTIIAGAAAEATARSLPAVIAVTDRVGNVLAVYSMAGARTTALTTPAPNGVSIDIQNQTVPAGGGAIAKAITGAYLSSGGNAFSTRTASQIVQQHFPPAPTTVGLESGPLYGVQFSQLPCSDLSARFGSGSPMIGPKRSPLGLAADPGGFPLYKNGVVVGGIGVMADGVYGFDPNILDVDSDAEEFIALAGTIGFEAPDTIKADRISVDGTTLRYSDATVAGLRRTSVPAFASIGGSLAVVRGYSAGAIIAGAAYGSEASGVRPSTATEFSNRDAFVLTDGAGTNRFPVRAGTDSGAMTAAETRALLEEAFTIMSRARAQIRRPLDSRAQVTISLVDTNGAVLGIVRSPDAPIFGTDVSLQKARTAMFFTNANAGANLAADPSSSVRAYGAAMPGFLGDSAALTGKYAYGARSIGNIARPYFPDGEVGRPNGPLSPGIAQFNPFATGLQSALIATNLVQHLTFVNGGLTDTPQRCTFIPDASAGQNWLQNGIQIFPGGVPVFRGNTLVGGLGVSGDGIDQDDMIAFLGALNGGSKAGTGLGNAPAAIRADQIVVALSGSPGVRLRYVSCPFAPFLDTSESNVCQGR